jgi:hypothetical protein
MIFNFNYQAPAYAAVLLGRVYRQQSEICPLTLQLKVHAADESGGVFSQEKIALLEQGPQDLGRDAVTLDEETLRGAERQVDYPHDGGDVSRLGPSN